MNDELLKKDLFAEQRTYKKKSKGIAYLIWLFLGVFGGHRYYVGDIGIGIAMTLTGGGGGLWFLIDVFFIGKRIESKNMDLELKREQDIKLWNQRREQEIRLRNQKREQDIRLRNQEIRLLAEQRLRRSGIHEVDEMTGEAFEEFLQILLKARGYKVSLTSITGDYGAILFYQLIVKR